MADVRPKRFGQHRNAFGFIRLLFASLVIVAHVPELVDGDRHRELLTRLVGTMSFGDLAVDGFFIISGFLITGSFVEGRSVRDYLVKRLARIYPGFLVASLVSLLIVAPLGGAIASGRPLHDIVGGAVRMLLLARPLVEGAFVAQGHSDAGTALNGALWTIQYEFLCYLLVILLVKSGVMRRLGLLAGLAVACLIVSRLLPGEWMMPLSRRAFLPAPGAALFRLVGMFLTGACYHRLQHRLRFPPWLILAAVAGFAVTLPLAPVSDLGVGVFGGYLIFAVAELGGSGWPGRINNRNDISYGLYLYAWPIERLLLLYLAPASMVVLGVLTWVFAALCGAASWFLIERRAMLLTRSLMARPRSSE